MSGSGPGRREVAYRLFATEFDDAEYSYSESDEERAPNFVVTPTGARVNRLFAVGVLTAVEDVNPEMVRGRVVDPTGAFVSYAGQYQPDELAFLERADPPTFLALSGKARTFEPEDGDRVFTSVRPESVSEVDAETRDRWVVTAAERTLERVGVMASAIESGLSGDRLRAALEEADVDERLADGVALALEYYGTTPAYLEALRNTALEALEVVAGDRDEVGGLDVAPDDPAGAGDAASLSTLELSEPAVSSTEATSADATDESSTHTDADAETGAVAESAVDAESKEDVGSAADAESEVDTEPDVDAESDVDAETATAAATGAEPDTTSADEDAESDAGAVSGTDPEPTDTDESESTAAEEPESTATEEPDVEEPSESAGDDESSGAVASEADVEAVEEEMEDFDPGEFELDEEERQEVEEEYGTEFSTADEVAEADESPSSAAEPESEAEAQSEPESDTEAESEAEAESDAEAESAAESASAAEAESAAESASEPETAEPAEDVDLDDAVAETMAELDDGDGADREELVTTVAEEYGAAPEDVEEAIQDALMSGRCYEPSDGVLKPI